MAKRDRTCGQIFKHHRETLLFPHVSAFLSLLLSFPEQRAHGTTDTPQRTNERTARDDIQRAIDEEIIILPLHVMRTRLS